MQAPIGSYTLAIARTDAGGGWGSFSGHGFLEDRCQASRMGLAT